MNAEQRQIAQIKREHFIMFQWIYFPETRLWDRDDWFVRLKAEGLLAKGTYRLDCPSLFRFIRELSKMPT